MSDDRRPISQRSLRWAKGLAAALAQSGVRPNWISFAGIVFAAFGGLCFYAIGLAAGAVERTLLCIGAGAFCQLRLLANMMDGMVAVEGGRGEPDGQLWNEVPDRLADVLILVGAGYGVAALGLADASLGWAAAVAALMTAYVREAARNADAPADYSGPMAKPHRMFVMTVAALLTSFDSQLGGEGSILRFALWIVLIGSAFTAANRLRRALAHLKARA
mgnify:CR=1 FL=1